MSAERELEESVTAAWTRLGAMFNVAPSARSPDVERLLLDSARVAPRNVQVFVMAATWLSYYGVCVAKRRLAVLTAAELELEHRPLLGLLLDWIQQHNPRDRLRFQETILLCSARRPAGPLLTGWRGVAFLELMEERASALSRKWGVWMEEFEVKEDALRPVEWIAEKNPSLAIRALCGGDLVATIAAAAAAGEGGGVGGMDFASESALARRYGASRAAVRDALLKLKLAGFVRQKTEGKSRAVVWKGGLFL